MKQFCCEFNWGKKSQFFSIDFLSKISKGFEQKLASFGLKTPFKVQMEKQKSSLRAIGKPNGHSQAEPS